jgi:hypothetical protein
LRPLERIGRTRHVRLWWLFDHPCFNCKSNTLVI